MTDITERPHLTSLAELPSKIAEIVAWTVAHPVDDFVFHLPYPKENKSHRPDFGASHLAPLRGVDAYMAGSMALFRFLAITDSTHRVKWKPEDGDIFFLNQEVANRIQFSPVDIVQCKEKTVEELLLNFDLPICRVAMNFAYDFFVSAQFLATVYLHRQNVPTYLKDKLTFNATLAKHMKQPDSPEDLMNIHGKVVHESLYSRFVDRLKKYQNRGYGVNFINTEQIIPWVRNRFHYGEWLLPQ